MRCFVAVELSEETKRELGKVIGEAKKLDLDATFPKEEQLHITLAFLGELSEEKVRETVEKLKEIEFNKFKFETRGTGFFPSDSFVRVFWAGVQGRELVELQKRVAEAIGYKEEREFNPHITIARLKSRKNIEALKELKERNENREFGETSVEKLVLKKSTLTPKGPVYEDVAEMGCK